MIPQQAGNRAPKPAFFLLSIDDVELEDNWFTMGLAGTGSKNTVVTDAFVPEHRTVSIAKSFDGFCAWRQCPCQPPISAITAFGTAIRARCPSSWHGGRRLG